MKLISGPLKNSVIGEAAASFDVSGAKCQTVSRVLRRE